MCLGSKFSEPMNTTVKIDLISPGVLGNTEAVGTTFTSWAH